MRITCFILLAVLPFFGKGQGQLTLDPLAVNSNDDQGSAWIFEEQTFVFSSFPKEDSLVFQSLPLDNIQFQEKAEIFPAQNFLNRSDGFVSYNKRYGELFYSDWTEDSCKGLFTIQYRNGNWKNIKPFPRNSKKTNFYQPAISPDGNTLVFSGTPLGAEKSDLYFSLRKKNKWKKPKKIQGPVNSPFVECHPFIDREGNLYFSSNREESTGKLDIFKAEKTEGYWSSVKKLEFPINSPEDDFAYFEDGVNRRIFLSSNRGGTPHIFELKKSFLIFQDCDETKQSDLCFEFKEEAGDESNTILYQWHLGDGTIIEDKNVEHCYRDYGKYTIILKIKDTLIEDGFHPVASYELDLEKKQEISITSPFEIRNGQRANFDVAISSFKDFEIDQYLWDFGDGEQKWAKNTYKYYSEVGRYKVTLAVLSKADEYGKINSSCITKWIKVIK